MSYRIQAQFVVVNPRQVLTNAQLVISQGRVAEIHETPQVQADKFLEKSVLLPGLINAHTHLEFSDCQHPFPAGESFPTWISQVVSHRRRQALEMTDDQFRQSRYQAIRLGLAESRQLGTVALVDIATQPWEAASLDPLPKNGDLSATDIGTPTLAARNDDSNSMSHGSDGAVERPQVLLLPEIIGLDTARFQDSLGWASGLLKTWPHLEWIDPLSRHRSSRGHWRDCGVSPHAPYSVLYPQVISGLDQIAQSTLIAMHVAESLEERQWLESGTGPFQAVYQSLGIPSDQPRMQIIDAIDLLAKQQRSLLIHGNYLTPFEMDRIAEASMAVVYCPRTHGHFGHRSYPLADLQRRNIPVLLGTDSRASNPDLSVWRECLTARRLFPQWTAVEVFRAATELPARVLGVQRDLGSLEIGKLAWMNSLTAPAGVGPEQLLDALFSPTCTEHPIPVRDGDWL